MHGQKALALIWQRNSVRITIRCSSFSNSATSMHRNENVMPVGSNST